MTKLLVKKKADVNVQDSVRPSSSPIDTWSLSHFNVFKFLFRMASLLWCLLPAKDSWN